MTLNQITNLLVVAYVTILVGHSSTSSAPGHFSMAESSIYSVKVNQNKAIILSAVDRGVMKMIESLNFDLIKMSDEMIIPKEALIKFEKSYKLMLKSAVSISIQTILDLLDQDWNKPFDQSKTRDPPITSQEVKSLTLYMAKLAITKASGHLLIGLTGKAKELIKTAMPRACSKMLSTMDEAMTPWMGHENAFDKSNHSVRLTFSNRKLLKTAIELVSIKIDESFDEEG